MCGYLVKLDVLAADVAPDGLINAIDAPNTMHSRSLLIVHFLLSRGELDPDVVSKGSNSFLSQGTLGGFIILHGQFKHLAQSYRRIAFQNKSTL
jgi:hypothetical protein